MNGSSTPHPAPLPTGGEESDPRGAGEGESDTLRNDFSLHPALFFDGVCNLCNSTVDWIIRHDKKKLYRFGSLQGETARKVVPEYAPPSPVAVVVGEESPDNSSASDGRGDGGEGLSTVVLVKGGRKYVRSTAIAHVLKGLGGIWAFWGALILLIPRPLRDWGYRRVANSRYKRFGKRDTCRLPSPEERDLFLP